MWLISDAPRPDASEPRRIGSLSYALAALPRGPILPPASMTAEEADRVETLRRQQRHRDHFQVYPIHVSFSRSHELRSSS